MAKKRSATSLPSVEEMNRAMEPVVLRPYEDFDNHDVVRFCYEKHGSDLQPANSLEVVFQHRERGDRTEIRFRGVEITYFPLIAPWGDSEIVVQNKYLVQHEAPRAIEVRMRFCDGMEETLFWAGRVEAM
jgi:hypothetical protein